MSRAGRRQSTLARALTYVVLAALACVMLLPFAWLVRSSLCDDRAVIEPLRRLRDFVPPTVHPENYPDAIRAPTADERYKKLPLGKLLAKSRLPWTPRQATDRPVTFLTYLLNTVLVTGGVVLGSVLSSSLCAYAFAFCRVRYNRFVFYGVLATMMLPGVVTLIPVFILFRELGWIDSLKPLIVPAFCGTPFAIFLFRQFFLGIPRDLIDAARIDGATSLQIYLRIVMPLSRPVIITVAIFSFMAAWNDFMGPLIFLNSQENWTLQLGLSSFMGQVANQWNLLMAATSMVLLTVIVVFFCLQRYFIRGIALTGLKG